jgi:DNA-binding NarL/FixJ family response regulator
MTPPDAPRTTPDLQDEIVRLLATLVRLQLGNQTQTIVELNKAGLANARIADLIGTTPSTVKVTVQRARKRSKTTRPSD